MAAIPRASSARLCPRQPPRARIGLLCGIPRISHRARRGGLQIRRSMPSVQPVRQNPYLQVKVHPLFNLSALVRRGPLSL